MKWTNRAGQEVIIDMAHSGLLDSAQIVSLTISESTSNELFRVRGKTLSLTILTGDKNLYRQTGWAGRAIQMWVDGVLMFRGFVATTPIVQPYNYELERFTLYADDTLTGYKYKPYTTALASVSDIFAQYLPDYIYRPVLDIDITKTFVPLEAITDTTTNVHTVLFEVAKLLNVEVCDGEVRSPLGLAPVATKAHYATTSLGHREPIKSAEVRIVGATKETTKAESVTEGDVITEWGTLIKERLMMKLSREAYCVMPDYWGLFPYFTFDDNGYINGRSDSSLHDGLPDYVIQYYRLGKTQGNTYLEKDGVVRCAEMQIAVEVMNHTSQGYAGKFIPQGSPDFETTTIVYPEELYIGSDDIDGSQSVIRTMADVDLHNVYYTKTYQVVVPPVTEYKPNTYLLMAFTVNLFPVRCWDTPAGGKKGAIALTNENVSLNYIGTGYGPEAAYFNIRLYKDDTLLRSLNDRRVSFDVTTLSGASAPVLRLGSLTTTTWESGTEEEGYIVATFNYEDVKECNRLEVDFLGIGGFRKPIYNFYKNSGGGNVLKRYSWDTGEELKQMRIYAYSIDTRITFASGYLADEDEPEIDVDALASGGDSEDDNVFYWSQDKGSDEVVLDNKLNSLVTAVTPSTVIVGNGYLGKVHSTLYAGEHYTEVFQLATIIDQRGNSAMALNIDLLELRRSITFEGANYRLTGYTYDAITGVYSCTYVQEFQPTEITIE